MLFDPGGTDCLLVAAAVLFVSARGRLRVGGWQPMCHGPVRCPALRHKVGAPRSGLDAHDACSGRRGAPAPDSVAEVCNDGPAGLRSGLHKFRVYTAGDGFVTSYLRVPSTVGRVGELYCLSPPLIRRTYSKHTPEL